MAAILGNQFPSVLTNVTIWPTDFLMAACCWVPSTAFAMGNIWAWVIIATSALTFALLIVVVNDEIRVAREDPNYSWGGLTFISWPGGASDSWIVLFFSVTVTIFLSTIVLRLGSRCFPESWLGAWAATYHNRHRMAKFVRTLISRIKWCCRCAGPAPGAFACWCAVKWFTWQVYKSSKRSPKRSPVQQMQCECTERWVIWPWLQV